MAGERFASLLERLSYLWHSFSVYLFDYRGETKKYLDPDAKPLKFSSSVLFKDSLTDLGIHSKDSRRKFDEWYKGHKSKKYRLAVSRSARLWKKELWRCADYGIRINNPSDFSVSQLRELRKLALRGYDIKRLQNPRLSAVDMRCAVPFLNYHILLTHNNIGKMRQISYEKKVNLLRDKAKQVLGRSVDSKRKNMSDDVLFNSEDPFDRAQAAENNYKLSELSRDQHWVVRQTLARKGFDLKHLKNDPDVRVRMEVVRQGYDLPGFAVDPSADVRTEVALAGVGLDKLVRDDDIKVVMAVSQVLGKRSIDDWIKQNPDKCVLPENKLVERQVVGSKSHLHLLDEKTRLSHAIDAAEKQRKPRNNAEGRNVEHRR